MDGACREGFERVRNAAGTCTGRPSSCIGEEIEGTAAAELLACSATCAERKAAGTVMLPMDVVCITDAPLAEESVAVMEMSAVASGRGGPVGGAGESDVEGVCEWVGR